jgi:hypothetical protein
MTGFEPATPRPPGVCATGLRYIPNESTKYTQSEWFSNGTLVVTRVKVLHGPANYQKILKSRS